MISIKDLVGQWVNQNMIYAQVYQKSVIDSWEEVVGKTIAEQTQKVYFHQNDIHICLDNATLKDFLQFQKEDIILKIKEFTKDILIIDHVHIH
ncbi:MAG: DUF721 domain-containing protein [Chitinophagales bacterium]|jgi:hypothetical protein|nr:DUF721 domain-containing protein [Chitinophagales bacterium]